MNIASFDIFDTTLIRKCGKCENVFAHVAKRLFPNNEQLQYEFFLWRIKREKTLSEKNPNYKIRDIYSENEIRAFDNYTVSELIETEESTEYDMLISNQRVVNEIKKRRSQGYKIVFISDMYLSSNFVKTVLTKENVLADDDIIYISNEHCARKDNGQLYEVVRNELSPQKWIHYGDNKYSDIKQAKKHGIKTLRISTDYTAVENMLNDQSNLFQNNYELSCLVGTSRMARIVEANTPQAILAADFLAPTYIPYVLHILSNAKMKGIKTLYFLSRDSYILQRIAEQIPHDNIEYKYLFVSRKSLILPYLYQSSKDDFMKLYPDEYTYGENVDTLLQTLGITTSCLQKIGVSFSYKYITDHKKHNDLVEKLYSPKLYDVWQENAKEQYEYIIKYFESNGLLTDGTRALVDVGWLGSTRMMINKIISSCGTTKNVEYTYYWGVKKNVFPSACGNFDVFMHGVKLSGEMTSVVEDYFSLCPYTTTLSYKIENGTSVPVLSGSGAICSNDILDTNINIVEMMTKEIIKYHISTDILYYWAAKSIDVFMQAKTAQNYSPLCYAISSDRYLVKKLSPIEIFKILIGKQVTSIDKFSLDLTTGIKSRDYIFMIHNKSLKIRTSIRNRIRH